MVDNNSGASGTNQEQLAETQATYYSSEGMFVSCMWEYFQMAENTSPNSLTSGQRKVMSVSTGNDTTENTIRAAS